MADRRFWLSGQVGGRLGRKLGVLDCGGVVVFFVACFWERGLDGGELGRTREKDMQRLFLISLVTLLISASVFAADSPTVSITIQSYQDLEADFKSVFKRLNPDSADEDWEEFRREMKIADLKGIDLAKPWQAAIWGEIAEKSSSLSFRIPVLDFESFRASLEAVAESNGSEDISIQQVGGYANVWIEEEDSPAGAKERYDAWTPAQLRAPEKTIEVAVHFPEGMRQSVLQTIEMGKMAITGGLGSVPDEGIPGMNPRALVELIGVYFEVVEMGIQGVKTLELDFGVEQEVLEIGKRVTAKANSELADWMKPMDGSLKGVLPFLNPEAAMAFAMQFVDNPSMMSMVKKFSRLGFEMQGTEREDPAIRELEKLMDAAVPMVFANSSDFTDDGMQFDGVYRFLGSDLDDLYPMFIQYVNGPLQSQVGAKKMYKTLSLKEDYRVVDGVSVDRFFMEINWDAPMYQLQDVSAQERERLAEMWPFGKVEFDMAQKGGNLFVGSPQVFDDLLRRDSTDSPPSGIPFSPRTFACGKVNIFKFMSMFLGANPFIPEEAKRRFQDLDVDGTDIVFHVELDNAVQAQVAIPLKVFSTIAKTVEWE